MAESNANGKAFKAVKRVLTGAVEEVLSHYETKPGRGKHRKQRSAPAPAQRIIKQRGRLDSSSSDSDFQQEPVRKKPKSSK